MNYLKLNDLPYDAELLNALAELENRIVESYMAFGKKSVPAEIRVTRYEEFTKGLGYNPGRKYLKIITDKCVWGFINLKNEHFKEGDILKAANWNAPALNKPRGNLLKDDYQIGGMRVYGPDYL